MDDNGQVSFQEESYGTGNTRVNPQRMGLLSRMVVGIGLAKDEQGAQWVLLIIAIIAILLAVYVFFFVNPGSAPAAATAAPTT